MIANLSRWWQNLTTTRLSLRRSFPPATLTAIDSAIYESEKRHSAEIRVAIETSLNPRELWHDLQPSARAREVFAELGVWDTAANNGVLVYLLLAERHIEIIADRGFAGRVGDADWRAVCAAAEAEFREGRFEAGMLAAVERISALVTPHFPGGDRNPNELANRPMLL